MLVHVDTDIGWSALCARPERKRSHERWENNIKRDTKDKGWKCANRFHYAQGLDRMCIVMKNVRKSHVPKRAENFLGYICGSHLTHVPCIVLQCVDEPTRCTILINNSYSTVFSCSTCFERITRSSSGALLNILYYTVQPVQTYRGV